jgi:hypothetical protein
MRPHLALCCLVLAILPGGIAHGSSGRASARPSCERLQSEDRIRSVSIRGELDLASGRTIKLLDVRLPEAEDDLKRPLAWLQSLAGRRVAVAPLAGGVDRWGRHAADVALLDEAAPIDLADLLVGEGFAMVDPAGRSTLCRPDLLASEQRARTRRLGLWASDRHGPVAASDMARLQVLVGHFAIVEGIVRSVGERRERTYLNFGRDWKQDLTITIPKRTWTIMRERGVSAATLRGKRVRARGLLEEWQGVAVEITAADMIEVIGQDIPRP